MNKRQRKKQQTVAIQKAYQSAGYSKKLARRQVADQRKQVNVFDDLLFKISSRLSEIKLIITNYDIKVNRLAKEIEGTYGVDPLLASWSNGLPAMKQIQEKLEYWWAYYGFDSNNQFYKNLCSAMEITGIQFDIISTFREIVEDTFQATNNFDKWVRYVQLEWLDKTDEVFYPSQEVRVNQAYNSMGYERHTLAEMEALNAL